MPEILVLDGDTLNSIVDIPEFVDVIEACFRKYSRGEADIPQRTVMTISGNWWGFMPGYVKGSGVAIKIVSVIPANRERGLPTIPGVVTLFDEDTGMPLSIMDGAVVTGLRTAAASMVSVKYLRPGESGVVVFIGGGYQARYHLRFITHFFRPEKVLVYDIRREAAEGFVRYAAELGVDAYVADSLSDALANGDIIIEASTTESPVVLGSHLKRDVHVVSIGAHTPESRALDDEVFMIASLVVVDSKEATSRESWDIRDAISNSLITSDDIIELGELGARVASGRPGGVTVYKSVGLALQDVCAARYLYNKAIEKGVGSRVRI